MHQILLRHGVHLDYERSDERMSQRALHNIVESKVNTHKYLKYSLSF